jgi:cytochrome c peroxidase
VTVVDLDRLATWLEKADAETRREAINDLSLSPEYVVARIPTSRNPRQVVLSPKGDRLFVSERLQDSVLVVDTANLQPLGRIRLGDGGLDDPIRRGEQVFTSSEYTFQHQFSCRSCHPDGHVDGLSYDFDGDGIGDNLLDNRSLQGVAGTAPFKWNGKNPSLEVQCGPRFARVLMRTEPFPPHQLHDLTTFIESLPPTRYERKRQTKLTAAQERGRAIFFAMQTPAGKEIPVSRRCVTCHPPPLYTVRLPFDVGSKGPRDTSGVFDTPHLLGVAYSAPYLHDGRAQTLEELWTVFNPDDMHGVSSYMNKIQLNDLIEFLKTL